MALALGQLAKALSAYFRSPAIKVGDKVYEGRHKEIHADIYDRMPARDQEHPEFSEGFMSHHGKYYERQAATKINKESYSGHAYPLATSEDLHEEQEQKNKHKPKAIPPEHEHHGVTPTVLIKSRKAEEPADGYHYHATNSHNAADIAHDKLRTHKPWHGTEQNAWPDGSIEKRAYFSPGEGKEHFTPEGGKPTMLRVHHSKADFHRESTGDTYVKKPIDSKHVEIKTEAGWKPLNEHFQKSLSKAKGITYEEESAEINKKSKRWKKLRHKFQQAEWTSKNGHPRCKLCGDEPALAEWCEPKVIKKGDYQYAHKRHDYPHTAIRHKGRIYFAPPRVEHSVIERFVKENRHPKELIREDPKNMKAFMQPGYLDEHGQFLKKEDAERAAANKERFKMFGRSQSARATREVVLEKSTARKSAARTAAQ